MRPHFKLHPNDFRDAVAFISSLCEGKDMAPSAREVRELLHDPTTAARFIPHTLVLDLHVMRGLETADRVAYTRLASLLLGAWNFYMGWAATVLHQAGEEALDKHTSPPNYHIQGARHLLASYPKKDAEGVVGEGGCRDFYAYRLAVLMDTPPAFEMQEGMAAEFLALGKVAEGWEPDIDPQSAITNEIISFRARYPMTFQEFRKVPKEAPWLGRSGHLLRVARHVILPWLAERKGQDDVRKPLENAPAPLQLEVLTSTLLAHSTPKEGDPHYHLITGTAYEWGVWPALGVWNRGGRHLGTLFEGDMRIRGAEGDTREEVVEKLLSTIAARLQSTSHLFTLKPLQAP